MLIIVQQSYQESDKVILLFIIVMEARWCINNIRLLTLPLFLQIGLQNSWLLFPLKRKYLKIKFPRIGIIKARVFSFKNLIFRQWNEDFIITLSKDFLCYRYIFIAGHPKEDNYSSLPKIYPHSLYITSVRIWLHKRTFS